VNALASKNDSAPQNMIMVSPPLAFIDFTSITDLGNLKLVVTGSRDEIAPPDMISQSCGGWNAEARFEVINGSDHFYIGYLVKLEDVLITHLENRQ
jgi:alpha/beta superfamily hydrolase